MKKNLILQTVYQIWNMCLPLVTAPYLSRRLGAEQLGIFSYTSSVVSYFALAAMLGTVHYGARSIAAVREDPDARSEVFWSVFFLQAFAAAAASAAYGGYLVLLCRENRGISLLQALRLAGCLLDISWFFFGMEKFEITAGCGMLVKLLTAVLVLLLVKTPEDLWLYVLITLGGAAAGQLALFAFLPRFVSFRKPGVPGVIARLRPNLVLFVPLLAMSVYHTMDKTMLGLLSDYRQSGFYYSADKVINIPISILNGMGTVMLPRVSALVSQDRREEAGRLLAAAWEGTAAVSIALACGIAAVSREFIPLFYGEGYEPCILLTAVFAPVLVVKSFSVMVRTQYLIPMEMESAWIRAAAAGAAVNLLFNLLLIPPFGALGAAAATLLAECAACALQLFALRGSGLGLLRVGKRTGTYLAAGLTMILLVRAAALLQAGPLVKLLVEIALGAVFYCAACLIFWIKTDNQFYKLIAGSIFKKRGVGDE